MRMPGPPESHELEHLHDQRDDNSSEDGDVAAAATNGTPSRMTLAAASLEDDRHSLDASIRRRLDTILLPFLALFFLVNSLDRSNVGNAETAGFTADAGLAPADLNNSVALFFAVFVAFQPGGAALGRIVGVKLYVPACMLAWGALTALHVCIRRRWQLYTVRLLIGLLEAGFYPCSVAYLSLFYTRYEFARRLGFFYGQYAVAGAVGGVLSYFVLKAFPPSDGQSRSTGWRPWQVLFLLEGCATITLAAVGFFFLPHGPGTAWFLSEEQRQRAARRVLDDRLENPFQRAASKSPTDTRDAQPSEHAEQGGAREEEHERLLLATDAVEGEGPVLSSGDRGLTRRDVAEAVGDWKVWFLLALNIMSAVPASAFSVFLPMVVHNMGFAPASANLFTAPPFLMGAAVLFAFVAWSDRRRERIVPILAALLILIAGLAGAVLLPRRARVARYLALCVFLAGSFVASPLTVAWMSGNFTDPGKRSIALGINGWGNLSGVFSSMLFAPQFAPDYTTPFVVTLSLIACSLAGFVMFRWLLTRTNDARRQRLQRWSAAEIQAELARGEGPYGGGDDDDEDSLRSRLRALLEGTGGRGGEGEARRARRRTGDAKLTHVYGL